MITVQNSALNARVDEAVVFPFDSHTIPFSSNLRLHMVPGKAPGQNMPIVVPVGEPGSPDDFNVRFYGTVLPVDGRLHMWYMARSHVDADKRYGPQFRPCYAVSDDGVNWEKPDLGLVEFEGSTANNIVNLRGGQCDFALYIIMDDPDDPDPARRYKCAFESHAYGNKLAVAYSPDGFNWTESPNNPVGPVLEHTGLIRHNGCYYVNGQGGSQYAKGRLMATFASYDFETWEHSCVSFRRDSIEPRATVSEWNVGEEVHIGAGLWDRGNVILGVYDIWHGHPSSDRRMITMDLGLIISHDALHFHEPIPDFRLIPAYEEKETVAGDPPCVSHGQGMLNRGDKTMLWYEAWSHLPVQVRLATWPRDRLGYFQCMGRHPGHFVTCPLRPEQRARVWANVDDLTAHSELRFEILDEGFHPLPEFSGENAAVLSDAAATEKGGDVDLVPGEAAAEAEISDVSLRRPVIWPNHKELPTDFAPWRIKVSFAGIRPEDPKLYALYVG